MWKKYSKFDAQISDNCCISTRVAAYLGVWYHGLGQRYTNSVCFIKDNGIFGSHNIHFVTFVSLTCPLVAVGMCDIWAMPGRCNSNPRYVRVAWENGSEMFNNGQKSNDPYRQLEFCAANLASEHGTKIQDVGARELITSTLPSISLNICHCNVHPNTPTQANPFPTTPPPNRSILNLNGKLALNSY